MGPHKKLTYRESYVTRGRPQKKNKPLGFQTNKVIHDELLKDLTVDIRGQNDTNEGVKDLSVEPGVLHSVPIDTDISTEAQSVVVPSLYSESTFETTASCRNDYTLSPPVASQEAVFETPASCRNDYTLSPPVASQEAVHDGVEEEEAVFIELDQDSENDVLSDSDDTVVELQPDDTPFQVSAVLPRKVMEKATKRKTKSLPSSTSLKKVRVSNDTSRSDDVTSVKKSLLSIVSTSHSAGTKEKSCDDSLRNDENVQREEAPSSSTSVLKESTVDVELCSTDAYQHQWKVVDNMLSRLMEATRQHCVVKKGGKVSKSNKILVERLQAIGKNLCSYGDQFLTIARHFENIVEQGEVDDIIEEDKKMKELEYIQPLNPSSESDSPDGRAAQQNEREEIVRKRKADHQNIIDKQKASDAEVKGSVKVLESDQGTRKTVFSCDVCHAEFSSKNNLQNHLRLHTSVTLQCNLCDLQLKSKARMRAHMNFHAHGPWKCNYGDCNKEFKWESSYLNHRASHFAKGKYVCPTCKKSYGKKQNFVDHCQFKHKAGKQVQCPLCTRKCKTKNALSVHLSLEHRERDEKGCRK